MGHNRKFEGLGRIVVKVGTSTLTYSNGQLNLQRIELLIRQLADLHNRGLEVVLVSSGAIGVGAVRMGWERAPKTMPEKQALAAIGQGALLHIYEKLFAEYSQTVAQVLLTRGDFDERVRYLNATNALLALLNLQVIPIVNENDTVATEEIKFGDNDTLSALVAGMVDADLLIILSDVDGLYDCDPHVHSQARLLSEVDEVTDLMEENSTNRGSTFSSGGMYTKLKAARVCMAAGVPMVIANSAEDDVLRRVAAGQPVGTLFVPREGRMQARKKWIAFGTLPQGNIIVDSGACNALLERGKSLLPSGITAVEGDFDRGTVVDVCKADGERVARGMVNYSAGELRMIAGKKTADIEKILGEKDYDEAIHRNNLWVVS